MRKSRRPDIGIVLGFLRLLPADLVVVVVDICCCCLCSSDGLATLNSSEDDSGGVRALGLMDRLLFPYSSVSFVNRNWKSWSSCVYEKSSPPNCCSLSLGCCGCCASFSSSGGSHETIGKSLLDIVCQKKKELGSGRKQEENDKASYLFLVPLCGPPLSSGLIFFSSVAQAYGMYMAQAFLL